MIDLGTVRPGSTIRIPFSTFKGSDGTAITMTNFAAADILIYKDGSTTERASTAGFTATTDFDGKTGKQLAIIDLSDNTTAGFFNAGSEYLVAVDQVTVDGGTTGGWIGRFRIGYSAAILDTTIATLSSQTSFTLTSGPAEDNALVGLRVIIHDIASAVQASGAIISAYTGSTKTVTLAAAPTFTISAGDNISVMQAAPLQPATAGRAAVVDANGLIDATTVKLGPSGSAAAQTALDLGGTWTAARAAHLDADVSSRMATFTPLTAAQIATGVWTDTTAGDFTVSGSVGKSIMNGVSLGTGLTVNALTNLPAIPNNWLTAAGIASGALDGKGDWSTYAGGDTAGTTTLLSRLTLARAAYLDNLLNLDLPISSLNNLSALCNLYGPGLMEKPDSSSTDYVLTLVVRDNEGKLVDLDSSPTLSATNAAGTDRSSNLSAVTHASTGVYTAKYNVTSSATKESLRIVGTGTVSSEARRADLNVAVVDYDSVTLLNTIASQTQASAIANAVLDEVLSGAHNTSGTLGFLAQSIQTIRDGQFTDMSTGLASWLQAIARKGNVLSSAVSEINDDLGAGSGTYDPATDSEEARADSALTSVGVRAAVGLGSANLDTQLGNINSKTTNLPPAPAAVGSAMTVSDKTGFKLASDGLDSISTADPTGSISAWNFRQRLMWLIRRFRKVKLDTNNNQIKTYGSDGTTVLSTQTATNSGGVQDTGDLT